MRHKKLLLTLALLLAITIKGGPLGTGILNANGLANNAAISILTNKPE